MSWFYHCDPCGIDGSCLDGCGYTWLAIISSAFVGTFVLILIAVIIEWIRQKKKSKHLKTIRNINYKGGKNVGKKQERE